MNRQRRGEAEFGVNRISKQYSNAHQTECVAFTVVASIWLVAALFIGNSRNLRLVNYPSYTGSLIESAAVDGAVATGGAHKHGQYQENFPWSHADRHESNRTQEAASSRDAHWFRHLHDRVALAVSVNRSCPIEDCIEGVQHLHKILTASRNNITGYGGCGNGSNPCMVVAYNGSFFGQKWPTHQVSCAVPCLMTSDVQTYGQQADALVFHAPEIDAGNLQQFWQAPKPPGQLWALHSMESQEAYTIQQASSPIWERVDVQANYKLSAVKQGVIHVPVPYLNAGEEYARFETKRPAMYNKTGLALWMHNNCEAVSSRQLLVKQLMQLMPVDSPGRCLHNMDAQGLNEAAPTELMAQYKFYFVFENVFGDLDWVSSTFFRALDAGTVPVVLGAPNVLKFAPGERSIIRACDFDSPQDLVDYLMYLDKNNTAYREYLAWKETGPSPEFKSLMHISDTSAWCRICVAAAARKHSAFDQHTQTMIDRHLEMKSSFDELNALLDVERSVPCRGRSDWWQVQLPEDEEAKLWA